MCGPASREEKGNQRLYPIRVGIWFVQGRLRTLPGLAVALVVVSEYHQAGHEHFINDVNDTVIGAHVCPCDGCSINLYAFQQG
jgi:hypothetical protein